MSMQSEVGGFTSSTELARQKGLQVRCLTVASKSFELFFHYLQAHSAQVGLGCIEFIILDYCPILSRISN